MGSAECLGVFQMLADGRVQCEIDLAAQYPQDLGQKGIAPKTRG